MGEWKQCPDMIFYLKIDTGMSRQDFCLKEVKRAAQFIKRKNFKMKKNLKHKMIERFKENLARFQKKLERDPVLGFIKKLARIYPKSEVYLVGGAVRDAALGREKKYDYDFVIRGVKAKDLEKFLSKLGKVDLVGKTFGVLKFKPKGFKLKEAIDIALPRTEHSKEYGGGYRDFEVVSSPDLPIEKDLSRRDFTINAMALALKVREIKNKKQKIKNDNLIDLFGGLEDLEKRIIRTVGCPEERFKEDYSRMLRSIRFSSELEFDIEKNTWRAIKKLMPHLNDKREVQKKEERIVPYEVISREFLKSLKSNPLKTLDLYDRSGALKLLIPEILKMKGCPQPKNWHSEGDVWIHTKLALEKLYSPEFKDQFSMESPSVELILGVLFHDIGKPLTIQTPERDGTDRIRFNEHDRIGADLAKRIGRRLKFSSVPEFDVDSKRIAWLVKSHLLFLHGNVEEMRANTIERYFFNEKYNGKDLLGLAFVDALSTIPEKGSPDLENFYKMLKRIEELKKLGKEKKRLPRPLINGHEIIKKFGLKPGPKIGELLKALREEQLSGRIKNKREGFGFLGALIKKSPQPPFPKGELNRLINSGD